MVTDKVRQFLCGLHGHDALLHFEQGRMSLQCTSCGFETPGWDLQVAKQASPRTAEFESTRVVHIPFADQRRVA
jgi:hypothetical protein